MRGLVEYDQMLRAIDVAHDVYTAKDIRDKAMALEHYFKQANNTDAEHKCREIRLKAERKAGILLKKREKAKGTLKHGNELPQLPEGTTGPETLADIGISKKQSSQFQQLADIPEQDFEETIETMQKEGEAPSTAGILRRTGKTPPRGDVVSINRAIKKNNDWVLSLWGWVGQALKTMDKIMPDEAAKAADTITGPDLKKQLPAVIEYLSALEEHLNGISTNDFQRLDSQVDNKP